MYSERQTFETCMLCNRLSWCVARVFVIESFCLLGHLHFFLILFIDKECLILLWNYEMNAVCPAYKILQASASNHVAS